MVVLTQMPIRQNFFYKFYKVCMVNKGNRNFRRIFCSSLTEKDIRYQMRCETRDITFNDLSSITIGPGIKLSSVELSMGPSEEDFEELYFFKPQDFNAVMDMYINRGQNDLDPYWVDLWPSSIAMAQTLFDNPELVRGKRVADFGCGLGLAGIAAAQCGCREVVFLDREPLALQCALLNSAMNGISRIQFPHNLGNIDGIQGMQDEQFEGIKEKQRVQAQIFDWFNPGKQQNFDIILACDVLYEKNSVEPVASAISSLLSLESQVVNSNNTTLPGENTRTVLLADDPKRCIQNRDNFNIEMQQRHLSIQDSSTVEILWGDDRVSPVQMVQYSY
eukprot:TRINITY_DN74014_c0_g1_i11.p1 TRINITY_DN74014_c0_g1~~TRINITY_DN74014_c0_g1_i11.p1  ORF type:complete len:333 (-),score=37.12 TRINITY_DN74014_c0_g1_i11:23-1021(-)